MKKPGMMTPQADKEQPATKTPKPPQAGAAKPKMPAAPKSTDTTIPKTPTAPKPPKSTAAPSMGKDEDGPTLDYSKFNKPKPPQNESGGPSLNYKDMKSKPTPKPWTGMAQKVKDVRSKIDADQAKANETALETIQSRMKTKKTSQDMEKGPIKAKSLRSALKRVPRKAVRKTEEVMADLSVPFIPLSINSLAKSMPLDVLREITLLELGRFAQNNSLAKSGSIQPEDIKRLSQLRSLYAKAEESGYVKYGDHPPHKDPPRNEDKKSKDVKGDDGSGGDVTKKDEMTPGDPNAANTNNTPNQNPGMSRPGMSQRDMIKEELKTEWSPKFYKKQGVPEGVDPDKHERCVKDVKSKGHDKSSAYAICNSSLNKDAKVINFPKGKEEEKKPEKKPEPSRQPTDKEKATNFLMQLAGFPAKDKGLKKEAKPEGSSDASMGKEEKRPSDVAKEADKKAKSVHRKLLQGKSNKHHKMKR